MPKKFTWFSHAFHIVFTGLLPVVPGQAKFKSCCFLEGQAEIFRGFFHAQNLSLANCSSCIAYIYMIPCYCTKTVDSIVGAH